MARLRLQASPVRRALRGALRGSARLVTLGGENDARSPDTRQSTCRVWWGDDWARAFLITGSDAEDSRLELSVYWAYWAKLLGVLVVSEVTAPKKVATVADDAMRCADNCVLRVAGGRTCSRSPHRYPLSPAPSHRSSGKLIAPSGMLLSGWS